MKKRATILIVDDEDSVQKNLVAYLEDEGFSVLTSHSGEEGLELVNRNQVDCVIVDMRLPGMDGNSFIALAHKLCPGIRFLIHTGSLTYMLPGWMKEVGIGNEHVFLKPVINMNAMMHTIHELIKK
jgi:DNA-binding NtrC family response regulator